jgi:hypothetical protein
VKHVEITKEGINRWFHKLRKRLYIKNSIYFALLVHRRSLLCTPDDALVVQNILSFLKDQIGSLIYKCNTVYNGAIEYFITHLEGTICSN